MNRCSFFGINYIKKYVFLLNAICCISCWQNKFVYVLILWASAPIGALKCDFSPFYEIMTDRPDDSQTNRPANRPTDQWTDEGDHREVTLPIMRSNNELLPTVPSMLCNKKEYMYLNKIHSTPFDFTKVSFYNKYLK